MKKFLKSKVGIICIAAVAVALTTALTASLLGGRANFIQGIAQTVTKPAQGGLTFLVDQLESLYGYLYEFDKLKAENEELKKSLSEMENTVRDADAALEEAERMRELAGFRASRQDITDMAVATIIARSPSNWAYTFTISKGASDGIEVNDVVITETSHVVGIVVGLSANTATVRSNLDPASSIGASISRSGATGILEGDFLLMQDGSSKLSYLPTGTEILTGDVVVTSGMGGVYPPGLVLGAVSQVSYEDSGLTTYAAVTPSIDLNAMSQVFVIKSFIVED